MEIPPTKKKVVITIGPADNPYAKILLPEKRFGEKDRRKSQTFITQDRRSGAEDRRNSMS